MELIHKISNRNDYPNTIKCGSTGRSTWFWKDVTCKDCLPTDNQDPYKKFQKAVREELANDIIEWIAKTNSSHSQLANIVGVSKGHIGHTIKADNGVSLERFLVLVNKIDIDVNKYSNLVNFYLEEMQTVSKAQNEI